MARSIVNARMTHVELLENRSLRYCSRTRARRRQRGNTGDRTGEHRSPVLQQDARHVAAVDDVERRLDEVPAAQRRQRLGQEHADQVARVGRGQRQQIAAAVHGELARRRGTGRHR